jgi:hypothetical protein
MIPRDADTTLRHTHTSARGERVWEHGLIDVKTKRTCAGCNGGWISRIDQRARSIIGPCIAGQPTTLDNFSNQIDAATWAFKSMVLVEYVGAGLTIPIAHRHHLWRWLRPPPTCHIWFGAHALDHDDFLALWSHSHLLNLQHGPTGERRSAYTTLLSVGQLVVNVFGYEGQVSPDLRDTVSALGQTVGTDRFIPIWPPVVQPRSWPPAHVLSTDEMLQFREMGQQEP